MMEEAKFKIGDKAIVKEGLIPGREYGSLTLWDGIMYDTACKREVITVESVRPLKGSSHYRVRENPFFWDEEMLEPAYSAPATWRIIIEGDENTSRAKYMIGREIKATASAKRNSRDKHDPHIAADLCVDRLFPEKVKLTAQEKPAYFNGKIVCVWKDCEERAVIVGKIYEVKDGVFTIDNGLEVPDKPFKTLNDFHAKYDNFMKFIEIKE